MFKDKISLIPHLPGSYQMKNKDGIIIYVGKAKNLRNRIASYFIGEHNLKTQKLVSDIHDFSYIVTSSELEAFILELNLIKKYNPKYNILLKDDKSYPYIEYVKKPYPELKVVRYLKIKKDRNRLLFGPYPNVYAARRIVKLLNRLYPLKKCKYTPKEVCLYYHIEECLGYCVKKINSEVLVNMENEILSFLKGNNNLIKNKILEKIDFYSDNLNYELAWDLKNELDYINYILTKQRVEILNIKNADVINYYLDKGYLSIEILFIRNTKIIGSHNEIIPILKDEKEDMEDYIGMYYSKHEIPSMIIVNKELNHEILSSLLNTKVMTSLKGEKKKILDMAFINAKINLDNSFEIIKKDEKRTVLANEELMKILGLNKLDKIEIFDNSNLFGDYSVSGMVVFKNGVPSKKDYRKFKISFDKNDDYHMMKEVIYRRYYRLLLEKTELPDLIIVDGGINQINATKETLDELHLDILVCGLKKNDKHKTSDLINGRTLETIEIPKDSDSFHYLTRIQDEVHRFTINYHRILRNKNTIKSELDNIEGIGAKRKKDLINKYKSLNKIKAASLEELKEILPTKVAVNLYKGLHKDDAGSK